MFSFSIPKGFEQMLSKISNIDEVAPKMLNAAAPVVIAAIKARAPVESGSLRDSVKASKPKLSKSGSWMCNIYFDGYETRTLKSGKTVKIPNMQKARTLEFGRRGRVNLRARPDGSVGEGLGAKPFILSAVRDSSEDAANAMQEVFETEAKPN